MRAECWFGPRGRVLSGCRRPGGKPSDHPSRSPWRGAPLMSKAIVITGAGAGLGRALARRFVGEGETGVLPGRTRAKVEAVAGELGERAMAVDCDVGSPDSVRAAFTQIAARFPTIDVLINNAAVYEPFQMEDATDQQILSSVATNLTGPMLCV